MKRLIALLGLSLTVSLLNICNAKTVRAGEYERCHVSLNAAVSTLTDGRSLEFESFYEWSIANQYYNYPRRRPTAILYSFSGSDAYSVMNSPVLLSSIAQDIMDNCGRVSIVEFGVHMTDNTVEFGLVGDEARQLECVDHQTAERMQMGDSSRLRWGQTICL